MDDRPPQPCHCGSEHFERVVIERRPRAPYRSPFMYCVECRAAFYVPLPEPERAPDRWSVGAIGGPRLKD